MHYINVIRNSETGTALSEKPVKWLRSIARKLYEWRWYRLSLWGYNLLVRLEPNNDNTWHDRGIIFSKFGQYDKAVHDYRKALEIFPAHDRAYYNIANTFAHRNKHQEAIEYFRNAIELNSKGLYWFGLALSQKSLEADSDALISIKKAIELGSGDAEVDGKLFSTVMASWNSSN